MKLLMLTLYSPSLQICVGEFADWVLRAQGRVEKFMLLANLPQTAGIPSSRCAL